MCWWFRTSEQPQSQNTVSQAQVEEGDLHSGPSGYSPNTAYPEKENFPRHGDCSRLSPRVLGGDNNFELERLKRVVERISRF